MNKITKICFAAFLFFTINACQYEEPTFDLVIEETDLNAKGAPAPLVPSQFITLSNDDNVEYCIDRDSNSAVTYPLWAGQHIDAGSVIVGNDEDYLYVTINSAAGFQNTEDNVKMWLGTDITELPTNKNGTPILGKFPYKYTVTSGDTNLTFQILLTDINNWSTTEDACAQDISLIVHGDVLTTAGDETSGETAFAGDTVGDDPRWWYLVNYTTMCCEEIPVDKT